MDEERFGVVRLDEERLPSWRPYRGINVQTKELRSQEMLRTRPGKKDKSGDLPLRQCVHLRLPGMQSGRCSVSVSLRVVSWSRYCWTACQPSQPLRRRGDAGGNAGTGLSSGDEGDCRTYTEEGKQEIAVMKGIISTVCEGGIQRHDG